MTCIFQFFHFHKAHEICVVMQAVTPEYRAYQEQVLSNSFKFAEVTLCGLVSMLDLLSDDLCFQSFYVVKFEASKVNISLFNELYFMLHLAGFEWDGL